jgi:hypothetical protein
VPDYVTIHLHSASAGRDSEFERFFAEDHVPALRRLRHFRAAQRYRYQPHQLMDIAQPWQYVTLYDFTTDSPEIDLPALAPLLAEPRENGLTAADNAERIYSYKMYGPWKYSANLKPGAFTHLMFLLANCVPGREAEYHQWYEDVHSVEVSESPGYVGMQRGGLSDVQIPPMHYCPGDQLILGGIQTDQLEATLKEFYDRAMGTSPSGVAWGDRSKAASIARTVHVFESVSPRFEREAD